MYFTHNIGTLAFCNTVSEKLDKAAIREPGENNQFADCGVEVNSEGDTLPLYFLTITFITTRRGRGSFFPRTPPRDAVSSRLPPLITSPGVCTSLY